MENGASVNMGRGRRAGLRHDEGEVDVAEDPFVTANCCISRVEVCDGACFPETFTSVPNDPRDVDLVHMGASKGLLLCIAQAEERSSPLCPLCGPLVRADPWNQTFLIACCFRLAKTVRPDSEASNVAKAKLWIEDLKAGMSAIGIQAKHLAALFSGHVLDCLYTSTAKAATLKSGQDGKMVDVESAWLGSVPHLQDGWNLLIRQRKGRPKREGCDDLVRVQSGVHLTVPGIPTQFLQGIRRYPVAQTQTLLHIQPAQAQYLMGRLDAGW